MKEELDKLNALQQLQNAQLLQKKVDALEEYVEILQAQVSDVLRRVSLLEMDLHTTKSRIDRDSIPSRE